MNWGILATGTIANKFATTVNAMAAEGERLAVQLALGGIVVVPRPVVPADPAVAQRFVALQAEIVIPVRDQIDARFPLRLRQRRRHEAACSTTSAT